MLCSRTQQSVDHGWMNEWMGGGGVLGWVVGWVWMDAWVGLGRWLAGWLDGWMACWLAGWPFALLLIIIFNHSHQMAESAPKPYQPQKKQ